MSGFSAVRAHVAYWDRFVDRWGGGGPSSSSSAELLGTSSTSTSSLCESQSLASLNIESLAFFDRFLCVRNMCSPRSL